MQEKLRYWRINLVLGKWFCHCLHISKLYSINYECVHVCVCVNLLLIVCLCVYLFVSRGMFLVPKSSKIDLKDLKVQSGRCPICSECVWHCLTTKFRPRLTMRVIMALPLYLSPFTRQIYTHVNTIDLWRRLNKELE